jgi:hypothetical protein
MALVHTHDRRPAKQPHTQTRKGHEPSTVSSLAMCLLAAILLGLGGWIAFEILLTLVTLD